MKEGSKTFFTGCALFYHRCGMEVTVVDGKVVTVEGQKGSYSR